MCNCSHCNIALSIGGVYSGLNYKGSRVSLRVSGYQCSVDLSKELLLKLLTMCSKDTADALSGSIHEDISMYLTSEGYLSTEHELGCVEIAKLPFEKDSLASKRVLYNYTDGLLGYALMTFLFSSNKRSSYSFGSFF